MCESKTFKQQQLERELIDAEKNILFYVDQKAIIDDKVRFWQKYRLKLLDDLNKIRLEEDLKKWTKQYANTGAENNENTGLRRKQHRSKNNHEAAFSLLENLQTPKWRSSKH